MPYIIMPKVDLLYAYFKMLVTPPMNLYLKITPFPFKLKKHLRVFLYIIIFSIENHLNFVYKL